MEPLFKVENPYSKASDTFAQAAGTYGAVKPGSETKTEAKKTAGGGISSAAGAAVAGGMLAAGTEFAALGMAGGPAGAAVGALIGLGAYLLS